ncbi:MAG: FAD-binding oxidoreductase [Rickettsia endosymbiont of Pseudomimeciton antennatum]|nr:FAD-binding oxidoreductase [Rickettsia endosymbiont of Pseudomimeciton antennatum]
MLNVLKYLKYSFTTIFLIVPMLACANIEPKYEVRNITPPNLEEAHLGEKILCYRPMRHGAPNMSVERQGNKIIANNYGHGGSGWTLGPGSAHYVNRLLEQSTYSSDLKKSTPITIIGAGVLGLYTAYDLVENGYTNITIIADRYDNLTSHNAGGLLAPVSMDNNHKMDKIINDIGIDAYKFYEQIAKNANPNIKKGAEITPSYFENRTASDLEPYVVGKVMKPAKDVILDFGNGTTRKMVAYDDGIFMDTATLMTELTNYLKPKVKFVKKKITTFSEIDTKYIINCTGLGAKELNKDNALVSVQGHLIMLKNQKPQDLQYMILIYLPHGKTESGQDVERAFYVFPKKLAGSGPNDIGVIGGTFIEGATPDTPNTKEFGIMIKDAKEFYGIK